MGSWRGGSPRGARQRATEAFWPAQSVVPRAGQQARSGQQPQVGGVDLRLSLHSKAEYSQWLLRGAGGPLGQEHTQVVLNGGHRGSSVDTVSREALFDHCDLWVVSLASSV